MTQPLDATQLPAFSVPPHLTDPSGAIAVWWTDPAGGLMQLTRPARGTVEMAEWLVGPAFELLLARFTGVSDLRVILDMRQMTGRSATARAALLHRAKSVAGRIGHVVLLPSVHLGTTYFKIVEGTAMMLRLAGLPVDVEYGLERVMDRYELRPAGSRHLDLASEVTREALAPSAGPRGHAR
jgi:hypothetical protein